MLGFIMTRGKCAGCSTKLKRKIKYQDLSSTICPRSSDPSNIVTYYIKWVTTSWTDSILFSGRQKTSQTLLRSLEHQIFAQVSFVIIIFHVFFVVVSDLNNNSENEFKF